MDPTPKGTMSDKVQKKPLETRHHDSSSDEGLNMNQIMRIIPRDNPNDPYKQHSLLAIQELCEGPAGERSHPLLPSEEQMIQLYGYDLDKCTNNDHPSPGIRFHKIPPKLQPILNRYPAWLRTLIEFKFDMIKAEYGKHTEKFLRLLVRRLEYHHTKTESLIGLPLGEVEDRLQYLSDIIYDEEENDQFFAGESADDRYLRLSVAVSIAPSDSSRTQKPEKKGGRRSRSVVSRESEASTDTTISRTIQDEEERHMEMWAPLLIQRAGDALRATLVAGASETEDEDYYEEGSNEMIRRKERTKGTVRHKDEEFVYRGTHWEAIVAAKFGFQEEAKEIMNERFMQPDEFKLHRKKKHEEEKAKRRRKRRAKRELAKASKKKVGHPLLKQTKEMQRKAALYRERGVGKRPSRLYIRGPCEGPIIEVERRLHQARNLEAIRAYANWIVASVWFKYFIMLVIIGNAALLAFETGESKNQYNYAFDILDSIFLSVYVAEFLLKFFAFPNQYFMSGFNIFDFVILVVSLMKSIADWLNIGKFDYLRFLTIIRALRILRGVSLSIHIQVLVKALLDTLKNHVVSVVLLLILLMYITSIVAFYLYGSIPILEKMFGSFDNGMLRLFAFVTMDGWTTIMDSFGKVGYLHQGRLFCLILIVLGNFLFSNIFIAIIIMQISDATDSFRKTRADERDARVSMKQDEVFRRQKLDMRQLLARQKVGVSDDFYELGSRFARRLRHDDLIDNREVHFSPLWMDTLYKAMLRNHHTSNIIMNQHRKMADRLTRLGNLYDENRLKVRGISRARYNRYYEIKSKLRLIKEQFLVMKDAPPVQKTKIRFSKDEVAPSKPTLRQSFMKPGVAQEARKSVLSDTYYQDF